jgi:hypothetical protein
MTINITANLLWLIAGIWYATGLASLIFLNVAFQGWKNLWRDLVMKFWDTTISYLIASLFGPFVAIYGLVVWLLLDAFLNKRK